MAMSKSKIVLEEVLNSAERELKEKGYFEISKWELMRKYLLGLNLLYAIFNMLELEFKSRGYEVKKEGNVLKVWDKAKLGDLKTFEEVKKKIEELKGKFENK
jgi:hypothetical protein